jgi:outer membrane protein OmpA-like peptidoglycan-associated protein
MPRSLRRARSSWLPALSTRAGLARLAAPLACGALLAACLTTPPPPVTSPQTAPPSPAGAGSAEAAWDTYVPERCRDQAAEGCPPRRIVTTESSIEIFDPISFVGNTAEIAPTSNRMIEAVARSLIGNPDLLVVEVRGHSDSLLHPEERAELARKRAEVVAAQLIAHGVAPERLTTYGASDSELLYPAGDPRNRRVEFMILARDE